MSNLFSRAWISFKTFLESARKVPKQFWIPTKFVIWQSTNDSIELLLNEPDASERRERTRLWRESKILELTTAAYTVSCTEQQHFFLSIRMLIDSVVGAYK